MKSFKATILGLLGLAGAISRPGLGDPGSGLERRDPPTYEIRTFTQKIDHFPGNPRYHPSDNGTFTQTYVMDDRHYKPGGPVFLYISGETDLKNRFENLQNGIIFYLMQATNGLGVILQNRYYGKAYPYDVSTVDNLRFLTNEQTIADNAYFAQNIKFPGYDEDLTAPNTPWILYGGSLAGAQTAFTMKTYGGDVFLGGISSSGVQHASLGYPDWYAPIQKYAPQDCVSSLNSLVDKIDVVLGSGNKKAIQELKTIFGLAGLPDNRDFARTITFPLGNPFIYPVATWQELNWAPEYTSNDFFSFCGNITNINTPASIAKVDSALSKYTNGEKWENLGNWADYIKQVVIPTCHEKGIKDINHPHCFGTRQPAFWARDRNHGDRSYLYTSCIEGGLFFAAPKSGPSLVPRIIQPDYTQQLCEWAFPPGKYNSIPKTPDLERWNKYGSYNFSAKNLAMIDGTIDPWLDQCYHATFAPERYSTTEHPELLIPGGGHHWDSYGYADISKEPTFIAQAHIWEIKTVQKWLKEAGFPYGKA